MQLVHATSDTIEITREPDGSLAVDHLRLKFGVRIDEETVTVTRGRARASIPLSEIQMSVLLEHLLKGDIEGALRVLVAAGLRVPRTEAKKAVPTS